MDVPPYWIFRPVTFWIEITSSPLEICPDMLPYFVYNCLGHQSPLDRGIVLTMVSVGGLYWYNSLTPEFEEEGVGKMQGRA